MNFVNRQLQPSIFKVFLYLIHSITDFGVRCFLYSRFPFICICYGIITDYSYINFSIEHDMIQIEPYTNVLRKGVFDFTERCFSELGKRLGSKLMQYAINYANDSGYKAIVLDSMSECGPVRKREKRCRIGICQKYDGTSQRCSK